MRNRVQVAINRSPVGRETDRLRKKATRAPAMVPPAARMKPAKDHTSDRSQALGSEAGKCRLPPTRPARCPDDRSAESKIEEGSRRTRLLRRSTLRRDLRCFTWPDRPDQRPAACGRTSASPSASCRSCQELASDPSGILRPSLSTLRQTASDSVKLQSCSRIAKIGWSRS